MWSVCSPKHSWLRQPRPNKHRFITKQSWLKKYKTRMRNTIMEKKIWKMFTIDPLNQHCKRLLKTIKSLRASLMHSTKSIFRFKRNKGSLSAVNRVYLEASWSNKSWKTNMLWPKPLLICNKTTVKMQRASKILLNWILFLNTELVSITTLDFNISLSNFLRFSHV